MLELVKRNIHMNRWKNQINTQVTLDDDFIVPDTMSDIAQVILDAGEIQLEPVKTQNEKAAVRGKLDFMCCTARRRADCRHLAEWCPLKRPSMCRGWRRRIM